MPGRNPPQDVGLPYMQDLRFPHDQLFIFAESDFRFYEHDCVAGGDWHLLSQLPAHEGDAWSTSSAASSRSEDRRSEGAPRRPDRGGASRPPADSGAFSSIGPWTAGRRPAERGLTASEELNGLVRMANEATRHGRGNVIWASWNSKNTRPLAPSYGTQLLMFTREGAQLLHRAMEGQKPQHWDIWLRDFLLSGAGRPSGIGIGASYILPAVGAFDAHVSGCDPGLGVRTADWSRRSIAGGVREYPQQERWLMGFVGKGPYEYVARLQVTDPTRDLHYMWKTWRPPSKYWEGDERWQCYLCRRGWVSEDLWQWWGPMKGKGKGKQSRKGGASRPPAWDDKYELLREYPHYTVRNADGSMEPITNLASEIVTDYADFPWDEKHTRRIWQSRKKAIAMYKMRFFVETADEAA